MGSTNEIKGLFGELFSAIKTENREDIIDAKAQEITDSIERIREEAEGKYVLYIISKGIN